MKQLKHKNFIGPDGSGHEDGSSSIEGGKLGNEALLAKDAVWLYK
jgi:hypothetical protein